MWVPALFLYQGNMRLPLTEPNRFNKLLVKVIKRDKIAAKEQ